MKHILKLTYFFIKGTTAIVTSETKQLTFNSVIISDLCAWFVRLSLQEDLVLVKKSEKNACKTVFYCNQNAKLL